MAEPGALERGWRKYRLLRLLAENEVKRSVLAKEFSVTCKAIDNFARRHAAEIATIRERVHEEIDVLWISKRFNRIAEYQQMVEDITDALDESEVGLLNKDSRQLLQTKAQLLHAVAEELGQLPPRRDGAGDGVMVVNQWVGVPAETGL